MALRVFGIKVCNKLWQVEIHTGAIRLHLCCSCQKKKTELVT